MFFCHLIDCVSEEYLLLLTGWLCDITAGAQRPEVMSWYIHSLLAEEIPVSSAYVELGLELEVCMLDSSQMLVL